VIPRNIEIVMKPMTPSVAAAFRDCGYLNAGTPFEIASTPVRAVVPAENALRIRKKVSTCSGPRCVPALSACGHPSRQLTRPLKSMM
jgi:hypothetical protein